MLLKMLDSHLPVTAIVRVDPQYDLELSTCHVGDVLSDALARAPRGALLVTTQTHPATVAVATRIGSPAVLFAAGHHPETATIDHAVSENIALFVTSLSAFEVAGILYGLGIRGGQP